MMLLTNNCSLNGIGALRRRSSVTLSEHTPTRLSALRENLIFSFQTILELVLHIFPSLDSWCKIALIKLSVPLHKIIYLFKEVTKKEFFPKILKIHDLEKHYYEVTLNFDQFPSVLRE